MRAASSFQDNPPFYWTRRDAITSKVFFALNAGFCCAAAYASGVWPTLIIAAFMGAVHVLRRRPVPASTARLSEPGDDPEAEKIIQELIRHPGLSGGKHPIKKVQLRAHEEPFYITWAREIDPQAFEDGDHVRNHEGAHLSLVGHVAAGHYIFTYSKGFIQRHSAAAFADLAKHELNHSLDARYGDFIKNRNVFILTAMTTVWSVFDLNFLPLIPLTGAFLSKQYYRRLNEFRADRDGGPDYLELLKKIDAGEKKYAQESVGYLDLFRSEYEAQLEWNRQQNGSGLERAHLKAYVAALKILRPVLFFGMSHELPGGPITFLHGHPPTPERIGHLEKRIAAQAPSP